MANKSSGKRDFGKFLNILGFIGIMLVAIALILAKIGGGELASAMTLVANAIAYLITAVAAFYYARSKQNVWYFVAFAVAVVLIIIFMIL